MSEKQKREARKGKTAHKSGAGKLYIPLNLAQSRPKRASDKLTELSDEEFEALIREFITKPLKSAQKKEK